MSPLLTFILFLPVVREFRRDYSSRGNRAPSERGRIVHRQFCAELTYLRLVKLDISGNRISVLPNEMRKMKSLVDFRLSDNPLTSPPASVSQPFHLSNFVSLTDP